MLERLAHIGHSGWNVLCTVRPVSTSELLPKRILMRSQKKPTTRFRLETLEGRDCPAVQVFNTAGVLSIVGDQFDNDIEIVDNGTDVSVLVDGVAVTNSPFSGVTRVVARGAAGDDAITFTASGSSVIAAVKLQGGSGSDTLTLDAATLDRVSGNASTKLTVIGGQGADTIDTSIGDISAGDTILLTVTGASGADNLNLGVSGRVDGTLTVNANSDQGNDSISASLILAPGSGGITTFFARGGQGDDNLTLAVLGGVNGSLVFQGAGGQGNDTVSVSGTVQTDSAGTASIIANGGQNADNVTLSMATTVVGTINAQALGGTGPDTIDVAISVSPNSTGILNIGTSGGSGIDTIDVDVNAEIDGLLKILATGDIGLDTITSTLNLLSGSTGRVESRVDGGLRKDTLASLVSIDGAAATSTSLDALLGLGEWSFTLDGNLGLDTGNFTSGVVSTINLETENPV